MGVEYTFLWVIENYRYCWHRNGERLLSPSFNAEELEGKSWKISVYPRGASRENKGYISLFLYGPVLGVKYEVSFLGADGLPYCSKLFDIQSGFMPSRSGWGRFSSINIVPPDILTVRCRIWKGEGPVRKVAPICARTRIGVEKISFLHMVENFSSFQPYEKKTVEIQSLLEKEFVVSSSLYFSKNWYQGKMIVKIMPSESHYILCKRKISLLDNLGNIVGCGEEGNICGDEINNIETRPLSLTMQDILDKRSEYLHYNKLSLLCECAFSTGIEYHKLEETENERLTPAAKRQRLTGPEQESDQIPKKSDANIIKKASKYPNGLEDIKALYVSQRLTDVELKTKTKSFPAHKVVLCARSPIFEAMLTSDMTEKVTGCIQIDDLGDDIVQQMLLFLYSDHIKNLHWTTATQLFSAGDKYQIGKLKEVCSFFLEKNLTTTNAPELLHLADSHSDGDLRKSVQDFILQHEKAVFGSKEWEKLMESNPPLALKTMHLKYKS